MISSPIRPFPRHQARYPGYANPQAVPDSRRWTEFFSNSIRRHDNRQPKRTRSGRCVAHSMESARLRRGCQSSQPGRRAGGPHAPQDLHRSRWIYRTLQTLARCLPRHAGEDHFGARGGKPARTRDHLAGPAHSPAQDTRVRQRRTDQRADDHASRNVPGIRRWRAGKGPTDMRRTRGSAVIRAPGRRGLIRRATCCTACSCKASMGLDVKWREVVRPGGGLVVAGAGCDASLQHADEAVGELMQRGGVDRRRGRGAGPNKARRRDDVRWCPHRTRRAPGRTARFWWRPD